MLQKLQKLHLSCNQDGKIEKDQLKDSLPSPTRKSKMTGKVTPPSEDPSPLSSPAVRERWAQKRRASSIYSKTRELLKKESER